MSQYCGNRACQWTLGYYADEKFCLECGTELTPYIQCLCGKRALNPKRLPAYCDQCGVQMTVEYLGKCMGKQLGGMVNEISQQVSVL